MAAHALRPLTYGLRALRPKESRDGLGAGLLVRLPPLPRDGRAARRRLGRLLYPEEPAYGDAHFRAPRLPRVRVRREDRRGRQALDRGAPRSLQNLRPE